MSTVVFLSDLHLSPTHGFFWDNFVRGCAAANAAAPAAVVVNGDLCINGPDSDAEMAFAANALRRIGSRLLPLPGNHDVGDEPPGQDAKQIVDEPRLARWDEAFGADRFVLDVGAWRLVGVNALLFGSGLSREAEQDEWLAAQLSEAGGRHLALVLHKPLFLESTTETVSGPTTMTPAPRARLLALLRQHGVRLVVSGHLHSSRDRVIEGIRYLWLPALAFIGQGHAGSIPAVGAVRVDFSGEEAVVAPLDVPGLAVLKLEEIKQHGRYRFLRDMPECPPPIA